MTSKKHRQIGFVLFHFIFMGVNPFDSAALGRLIERVVDSGFMVQKNPKHHFRAASIKTGYSFPKIIKQFRGKTYPVFESICEK